MSRPGAVRLALSAIRSLFTRYTPSAAALVYDPAKAATWRAMVDAADRFDVYPTDDEDEPIRYALTDKATA